MNHSIETPYHIVYCNNLSSLQHIHSIPDHSSLNPLHTNFHHENCQFSLIAFTLYRCSKSSSLFHTLQISSHLFKQYFRQFRLPIYLLAYWMHLEYHYEGESCTMESAQFKASARSIFCYRVFDFPD